MWKHDLLKRVQMTNCTKSELLIVETRNLRCVLVCGFIFNRSGFRLYFLLVALTYSLKTFTEFFT